MKKLIFFLLYFSEGAPIGFIWWALPAYLETQGYTITQTATISAIATIPWSFKFLLAPIVDLLSMKTIRLKKQLLIYQLIMGIGIYFVPQMIKAHNINMLISVIVFHGLFAALQDICIDALAIRSIPEDEIGKINGIMQAGMLVGRSLFGGAGVYIIYKIGLDIYTYFLISSIWISIIMLQKTNFHASKIIPVSFKSYLKDFYQLLMNKKFWLLIGVTYFSGYSYNGISTISSAMLSKFGSTPLIHGLTYSLFLPIAMVLGALTGGYFSDKTSAKKVLSINLLMSIITSISVGMMFDHFTNLPTLIIGYIIFYFFIGSTTTSLYSFLMQNTSKRFAALEYSVFMGVVNLCDSSTSYLAGQLVISNSYTASTIFIGLICLITYLFLSRFKTNLNTL